MRLITHNVLRCAVKGVEEGYPLKIEATDVQMQESPCRPDFVKHIIPTLNWQALRQAAVQVMNVDLMLYCSVIGSLERNYTCSSHSCCCCTLNLVVSEQACPHY